MLLCLYTGLDHHGKMQSFGLALVCDETAETYKWLHETFLSFVAKFMVVDMDLANEKALDQTMCRQGTHVQFCLWYGASHLKTKMIGVWPS